MAYYAVTSLMSTLRLLMQINPLFFRFPNESLREKVEEQTQSLCGKVGLLQALLETLEKNFNDREEVDRCEGEIKDAVQEAEGRIESVLRKFYVAKNEKDRGKAYEELCRRLQQACKSIECKSRVLKGSMKTAGLQRTILSVQNFDLPEHSPPPDHNMIGHENELEHMRRTLTIISSNETQVMAIVGMGGIGKTTFSRRIYDDPMIKTHFDILAWVTMSKEYCIRKMLLQLLHCISSPKDVSHKKMDDGELAAKLKQELWRGRYLVVIDDIWSTSAWDDIRQWFPDSKGSHIVLTTRCGKLATYAAPGTRPHHMSCLSVQESWELLQSKVQVSPELLEVGKRIAENCHGVPLTITIVAGLLSKYNGALDGWEKVAQDVRSAVFDDPGRQCEKILALSYFYLPQHLKACFLYFGIFPEDNEVNVAMLIHLWVAEGLLKESDDKRLEEVAEECLHELIDRKLVLVSLQNFRGGVETCKIHDLLRELCLRQAQSEDFLPVINKSPPYQASRELCLRQAGKEIYVHFISDEPSYRASSVFRPFMHACRMIIRSVSGFHQTLRECRMLCASGYHFLLSDSHRHDQTKLRTIINQCDCERLVADNEIEKRVLASRTLHLRYSILDDFPSSLFGFVHLRYLSMPIRSRQFPVLAFPNLQFLTVEVECSVSEMKPFDIWLTPQLRYVHFMKTEWQCPQQERGVLKRLHTIIGVGPAWCKKEIFAQMPNLKKLEIVLDQSAIDPRDLRIAISCFPLVEALRITVKRQFSDDSLFSKSPVRPQRYGRVCDNVPFEYSSTLPLTLTRLTLGGSCLHWEAMDIVGMLPNLESLELEDNACGHYSGTTWKLTRGVFPRLKFLSLRNMGFFNDWKVTDDHFPDLERLFISHCLWLKEIPQEFANILTLKVIALSDCSVRLAKSAKQIQREQHDNFGGITTNVRAYNCKYVTSNQSVKFCREIPD